MTKKSILITGCSSGIGYDAAHGLAERGWRVFATCRAETDCERLRSEGLESFTLNYEDSDSISAALAEVLKRTGGTLDAVYNNGAFALPSLWRLRGPLLRSRPPFAGSGMPPGCPGGDRTRTALGRAHTAASARLA